MEFNVPVGSVHLKISTDRFDRQFEVAQKVLNQSIITDTTPFVPFRTGVLRNSAIYSTELGSSFVAWRTPYAHYQYVGKTMVGIRSRRTFALPGEPKEYNGGTLVHTQGQSQWFEASKKVNLEKWVRKVKRVGGGG